MLWVLIRIASTDNYHHQILSLLLLFIILCLWTYVRFTTGPVPPDMPNRLIPITGLIPPTWLKIICHSHKWADFSHNLAENYIIVIPTNRPILRWQSNWCGVTLPEWRQLQIEKDLGLATTILPHDSAGNWLWVALCKQGPQRYLYPKRQKYLLTQFSVLQGNILNKQMQKKQFTYFIKFKIKQNKYFLNHSRKESLYNCKYMEKCLTCE